MSDLTTGTEVRFKGLGTRYLIRGDQTEGRFALLEHDIASRALAAPLHTHANEDEYSWVLSGRVGFQVGDATQIAGPGELVVKPRAVPHAFWNAGDEEARLLELISPAGFESYFEELAPVLNVDGEPDFQRLGEIRAAYGLAMDVDSIGPLAERHGLVVE